MPSITAPAAPEKNDLGGSRRGSGSGSHPHRERRVRESHPTSVRKPNPRRSAIHRLAWQAWAIAAGLRGAARLIVNRALHSLRIVGNADTEPPLSRVALFDCVVDRHLESAVCNRDIVRLSESK